MGNSLKKNDTQNFIFVEDDYKRPQESNKTEVQDSDGNPLLDFEVQSEYSEAPIKIRPLTEEEKNQPDVTNVTVYKGENEVRQVAPGDLSEFIKNNTDIRKVVVEKIGVEEANRVEVLYDKKRPSEVEEQKFKQFNYKRRNEVDYIPEEKETHKPRQIQIDLQELDQSLNYEFLTSSPEFKGKSSNRSQHQDHEDSHLDFNKKFEKKKDSKFVFKSKLSDDDELAQKVENKIEDFTSADTSDDEKELKKLSYEKHTLSKKRGKQHNGFYYKAKDHVELFKTGSQYLKDFKEGLKSFAFSSYDLDLIRQKTVFGVSTFFNYHTDVKTLIVSEGMAHSFYYEYMGIKESETRQVFDEELTYDVGISPGIELMDFEQVRRVARKIRSYDFEDFVDFLVDSYDLILWDMPEVKVLDGHKEVYFPVIRSLDSVSLIVAKDKTKIKEVHDLVGYYKKYQVEIKGLLYNPDGSKASDSTFKKKKDAA